MDRLLLPHEPIVEFARIPFLITEPFDDNGGDFSTFLPRHGRHIRSIAGKASVKRDGIDASIAETGAILQTWARLELASAFMGQRIDHECLKAYWQHNVYFSTKVLGKQTAHVPRLSCNRRSSCAGISSRFGGMRGITT